MLNVDGVTPCKNHLWIEHKKCNKLFAKGLKCLSKEYKEEQIRVAINLSELDKHAFWKMLKKERDAWA